MANKKRLVRWIDAEALLADLIVQWFAGAARHHVSPLSGVFAISSDLAAEARNWPVYHMTVSATIRGVEPIVSNEAAPYLFEFELLKPRQDNILHEVPQALHLRQRSSVAWFHR